MEYTVQTTGISLLSNDANLGGGINSVGTSNITITNSLIAGNTATRNFLCAGGGISTEFTSLNIMNSTIANNSSSNHGSAIDVNDSNTITITNTIFDGNYTSGSVNEIPGFGSTLNMDYSIYYTTFDGVGGGTFGANMISVIPTFVDPGSGDYSLMSGSGGIDTGTSTGAPAIDIIGASRGLDGDGSGAITGDGSDYDIGAYEYNPN